MANRRSLNTLTRHYPTILSSSSNPSLQSLKILNPTQQTLIIPYPLTPQTFTHKFHPIFTDPGPICYSLYTLTCHFSSHRSDNEDDDDEDEEGCDDDSDNDDDEEESVPASNCGVKRVHIGGEKGGCGCNWVQSDRPSRAGRQGFQAIRACFRYCSETLRAEIYGWIMILSPST